jgi:hypothetical protein
MSKSKQIELPDEKILNHIFLVRGEKVMFDFHLAILYQVETRSLKQAVKRNPDRFPDDFMFELSLEEIEDLVSQNVIPSKQNLGGAKPFAFTEAGVAMLSSVLKSKRAIETNVSIIRTFVMLRKVALNYQKITQKVDLLEKKFEGKFKEIQRALSYLLNPETNKIKRIGFKRKDEDQNE